MTDQPTRNRVDHKTTGQAGSAHTTPAEKASLAKWSLAFGVVSFFLLGQESNQVQLLAIPVSIGAIVCGHLAIRLINKSSGKMGGRGMAIPGLVLGYLTCFTVIMFPVLNFLRTLAAKS